MTDKNKCNSLTKSCTSYTKALVEVNKYMDAYFPNAEWEVTSMKTKPKDTMCMFDRIEIDVMVLSGCELFRHLYFWYNSDVDELDETPNLLSYLIFVMNLYLEENIVNVILTVLKKYLTFIKAVI